MPRNVRKKQALSPPAPLPTPLPDLPVHAPEPLAASSALDDIIDFHEQYTSPPFREAQLPDDYDDYRPESPAPLPIPPRIHSQFDDLGEGPEEGPVQSSFVTGTGHTRTPTVPKSSSTLQSLSRTIKTYAPQSASAIRSSASAALRTSADALRTYVPSSVHIPVPSAAPSPPMVSRPLSYGRFSVDPDLPRQQHLRYDFSYDLHHEVPAPRPPSGLSSTALGNDPMASYPRSPYPEDSSTEVIAWTHWDIIPHRRRVLVIGYTSGLQIWDCQDLASVTEILNLNSSSEAWFVDVVGHSVSFRTFLHAAILPSPSDSHGDLLASHRPLLGILMSASTHSAFFVYSLNTHQIVQRIALPGIASTFQSNNHFIVISTTLPPTVHIFSASTFHSLWTLPSTALAPFSPVSNVSLAAQVAPIDPPPKPPPTPVFALSNRLLAYPSPSPHQPRRLSTPSSTGSSRPSPATSSSSPFGFTQNDLGNAAIKVGGTVLSGMKFLGGIAYEAAKNKITEASGINYPSPPPPGTRFFSRSAPADERPFSMTTSTGAATSSSPHDKVIAPHTNPISDPGHYVTVLDLKALLDGDKPVKVAEFKVSNSQPVSRLGFSKDGCSVISVPENGQVVRVFALRPRRPEGEDEKAGDGVRMYDLRRGRTSVLVEGVDSTRDGLWVAIATRNRTVHVFPTNPLGGKPDLAGHLQGKVKNIDELQTQLVEAAPLARLRPLRTSKADIFRAPLTFTFVHPNDVHLPVILQRNPPKYPDLASSPPSPSRGRRTTSAQDILVFDPADGMLSLRRVILDQKPKDQLSLASVSAMGVVSRSVPTAVGSPSHLSASPGAVSRASSNSTTGQEVAVELVGHAELVATWSLRRKEDWEEIRNVVNEIVVGGRTKGVIGADWLAQAELSTCSRSPRILPRSLYLSHQFTFWTLGEDYHALLRQYHFDVRGTKIHVRREVQVSVGVGLNNPGDRFVEELDLHHAASSSFDEPLASALAGDLVGDYANAVPAILPMYPNGVSGTHASSLTPAFIRNSIPIRRLGDGMSEGIGRIRREISSSYSKNKIRSPSRGPTRREAVEDTISVPLEFDEEDEDFLGVAKDDGGDGVAAALGKTGVSAESRTSGTSVGVDDVTPPTPDVEDIWQDWESREVGQAVEEVEKFDDISVVGFLDEENQQEKERVRQQEVSAGVVGKKGKKGKKMAGRGT